MVTSSVRKTRFSLNAKPLARLVAQVYKDFGFTDISYKVATRPAMRIGSDETWDNAERALMQSLEDLGIKYDILEGEGAFYGPKVEYHLKDCLGRSWQCRYDSGRTSRCLAA